MSESKTRREAITEGRSLLQKLGFNGFSFQDIANRIGIKKPSLYAHFASKEELGLELIANYQSDFIRWTEKHKAESPLDQIEGLFRLFLKFAEDHSKICPLTILSAEYQTLPKKMQQKLTEMAKVQETWLINLLREGRESGVFRKNLIPEESAQTVLAMGFGVQHLARIHQDSNRIARVGSQLKEYLEERQCNP